MYYLGISSASKVYSSSLAKGILFHLVQNIFNSFWNIVIDLPVLFLIKKAFRWPLLCQSTFVWLIILLTVLKLTPVFLLAADKNIRTSVKRLFIYILYPLRLKIANETFVEFPLARCVSVWSVSFFSEICLAISSAPKLGF